MGKANSFTARPFLGKLRTIFFLPNFRLDYAGIAFLIVGSIIPWLYYGFYCQPYAKTAYIVAISLMGTLTIGLTLWDRFNQPGYRVFRTLVFVSLACASVVPAFHYFMQKGLEHSIAEASLHCTAIMAALYLTGATLYAARIPERCAEKNLGRHVFRNSE